EVVGFLGPNGAGKTTTMRLLTGTLQPDAGQVLFEGTPIGDDLTAAKSRVGYLPEANPLYDEMLVCEYLEFVAALRGLEPATARSGIRDAVEETGLGDVFYRPISELSKGYRQRTGMAAAILHRPEILVLDEPTEGLDPNQRVEIRRLVNALGSERTVLLSTHVMQEVEATCSRLLIITRGSIAADGTVAELMDARKGISHYTVEVEGDGAVEALAALPGVAGHSSESREGRSRIRLESGADTELRPLIFNLAKEQNWVLWELRRERATLEQIFRELTTSGVTVAADGAPRLGGGDEPDAGIPDGEEAQS
ncbi:MAG: ABC transporter ATP-binding protein, partial [Gemmatimonadota bacterium]|nr:ABC transporter ATP-binding protein [Gemmatimonadota bacterium]